MDRFRYLINSKNSIVSSLPRNNEDVIFSERVWAAVLEAASRDGKCDFQFLVNALKGQPRDCLMTPQRRKEFVASISPLLECDDEVDTLENVGLFVKAVQQFHNVALSANGGVCRLGHPHALLYIAAGVTIYFKLNDSYIISSLLKSIFVCDGGLDKILAPPLLGHRLTYVLSGWRPHYEDADKTSALTFWAMHAIRTKLTVGLAHKRIQDAPLHTLQFAPPLTVAVQADNVVAVRKLLVVGAQVNIHSAHSPLLAILSKLSTFARSALSVRPSCLCDQPIDTSVFRGMPSNMTDEEYQEMICVCDKTWPIFWPKPGIEILHELLSCTSGRSFPNHPEVVHPRIILDKLIKFPSLKQSCRFTIRQILHQNWQLPFGVDKLQLPIPLQKYLMLEH